MVAKGFLQSRFNVRLENMHKFLCLHQVKWYDLKRVVRLCGLVCGLIFEVRLLLVEKFIQSKSFGVCPDQAHSSFLLLGFFVKFSLMRVLWLVLMRFKGLIAKELQVGLDHVGHWLKGKGSASRSLSQLKIKQFT
jgi:hypothetical protein